MTALELLREAKRLIEEKGWTQGDFARNSRGNGVSVVSRTATCFCAFGALQANAVGHAASYIAACDILEACLPEKSVVSYNDHPTTTKADILALYDRAIERAERMETTGA